MVYGAVINNVTCLCLYLDPDRPEGKPLLKEQPATNKGAT